MSILDWKQKVKNWKRKCKTTDFVVLLLMGVLFMIIAIPGGKKEKNTEPAKKTEQEIEREESWENELIEKSDYIKNSEEKLTEILESMEGVGRVKVMLTLKDEGQRVLDKNTKASEGSREEETVIYEENDVTKPYVTSRKLPRIEGVFVVAQGGGKPQINSEISDAIMALFDVELHKIKIVKMSEQED